MQAIRQIRSRTLALPASDVDTDQIIPARFLTTTSREGLGQHLFHDWRFHTDGRKKADFVLNTAAAEGCDVLVAGHNFGCGSSREHAPWALLDYGFRAVISTEIADIFRSNALKNGLVPIVVDDTAHAALLESAGSEITIDVVDATLRLPDGSTIGFPIDAFARHCLVEGIGQLGFLRQHEDDIARFEESRSWTP